MLAFGPPEALAASDARILLVELRGGGADYATGLRRLPGVRSCITSPDGSLRLELDELSRDTPAIVRELVRQGGDVLAVRPSEPSLEEIYLRAVALEDVP
jgi:hypothetical protein